MNNLGTSTNNIFIGDVEIDNGGLNVEGDVKIGGDLSVDGAFDVGSLATPNIQVDSISPFTAGAQTITIENNSNQTIMNLRNNKTVDVDGKIQSIVDDLTLASASNISVCRLSDGIGEVTGTYITPRVNANELRGITSSAFDDPRITFVNNGIEFSNGSGGVIPARVEDTHFKISTYTLPENSGTAGQVLQTDGTNASWQSINALNGVLRQEILSTMPSINPTSYFQKYESTNTAADNNIFSNINYTTIGGTYPAPINSNYLYNGLPDLEQQFYVNFSCNPSDFGQMYNPPRLLPTQLAGGSSLSTHYAYLAKSLFLSNAASFDKITLKLSFNSSWSGSNYLQIFCNYINPPQLPAYNINYLNTVNSLVTGQHTDVFANTFNLQNQLTLIPATAFTNARASMVSYEFDLNKSAIAQSGQLYIVIGLSYTNGGIANPLALQPVGSAVPSASQNYTNIGGFILSRFQIIGYSVSNGAVAITSNHDLLSNLGSESHTAYLTLSGNRLMAGALQMDDHAITDVTNITSNNGAFSEISFTQPAVISYNAFSGHNFDTAANDLNYNFEIAGTNVLSLGSNGGIDNTSNLPLRMSLYPILDCQNVCKAWASIKTNSILQSYNIAACNQIATGQWNLIFNTALNSTEYAVIVSCQFNGAFFLGTYGNRNNSDFDLHFNNLVLPADPDYWSVCVYEYP